MGEGREAWRGHPASKWPLGSDPGQYSFGICSLVLSQGHSNKEIHMPQARLTPGPSPQRTASGDTKACWQLLFLSYGDGH